MMNPPDSPVSALIYLLAEFSTNPPHLAYVGPGVGLSAIGALLAVIAGAVLAVFGFVWYPVKRLLRRRRKDEPARRLETNE